MATKTKIKQTFDVKTLDTPSDLVVNNNQLSVFDYGDIATRYGDNVATELKGLEHQGDGILNNAQIDFGNVLRKGKALVSHGDFEKWYTSVWGLPKQRATEFMLISEAHDKSPDSGLLFPQKLYPAVTMAKAILKAPEDKREELVEEIKEKREKKGKDLTEAEINELPTVKQLKEKLKAEQEAKKQAEKEKEELKKEKEQLSLSLENTKTRIDNVKSYMESQIETKEKELKKAQETIANQNKQIQELNSNISAKQKELTEIQTLKEELEDKQAHLDSIIAAKASVMATEEINKENKALAKQIKDLKAKEEQIQKELKQVESLKITAQKQKENFDLTTSWLNSFQLTNEYLNEITGKLKQYKKELEKTPDLSQFDDEEKANLEKAIQDQVVDFNDNLHSLGGAINYLNGTIVKFNNHALRVINAEVNE